jgi:hypothetical protein
MGKGERLKRSPMVHVRDSGASSEHEEPCGKTAGYLNVRNYPVSYSLVNPAVPMHRDGKCARYPFRPSQKGDRG